MITFREATAQDTPQIVAWRNDPDVMRFFFYRAPLTEEGHNAWRRENIETGRAVQYMILETQEQARTERPVGICCLQHIDDAGADYGYLIGEADARGRGYGTGATRFMTGYAKNTLGLQYLTAKVMADNAASLRSFEKAGFVKDREEDTVCSDGTRVKTCFLRIDL